ncbi:MAG TPA: hypothetical protein VMT43_10820 [Acidimicrobiales bacterium]|nr:hypothetical protein [Acidimicrobiales bacterium]
MFDLAAAVADVEEAIDRLARGLEPEQITASAAMARAATNGGTGETAKRPGTRVVIRADLAALRRGHVADGETCEVAGVGPVPVRQVNHLLTTGEGFTGVVGSDSTGRITRVAHRSQEGVDGQLALEALERRSHDVTGFHSSRKPNIYQRSALDWISPCCSVEGCDQPRQEIEGSSRQTSPRTPMRRPDGVSGRIGRTRRLVT